MPCDSDLTTLAVFPVLVGPLQTLLAFLPAILFGIASMVFAVFKPGGFVKLLRFCWRQKLFLGTVSGFMIAWQTGVPSRLLLGFGPRFGTSLGEGTNWDTVGGGALRRSRGPGQWDATDSRQIWANRRDGTILSSAAISGDRVIYSTATDIGPFTPKGKGAIVCVDAHSGQEIWRYAPDNYRATFSSPVVWNDFVVCGEGLHQVDDARVTCLNARTGERLWELRTKSHVEATAAIAEGRVFIGAGSDGFYCLAVEPDSKGQARVLWHLNAAEFADCESSATVHEGVVYFGLGEGGNAVCAVQAETGQLRWKVTTPYPVFAPPTIADGKLFISTGNGNYIQSASDLLEMKLQTLRDDDATEQQLAEARERFKPVGEVWCIDLTTHVVDWKFATGDAILGAIVVSDLLVDGSGTSQDDTLYFGSRDGYLYRVSRQGELLTKSNLREPLISSPALGWKHLYCTTSTGRLICLERASLKPVWDSSLGPGATFASSPAVAHGHVYIGTPQQGILCVGRHGIPDPPLWAKGDRGGNADDVPVPELATVLWKYPAAEEPSFVATAPLMPLDGAIYAAGSRSGQSEVVKVRVDASDPSQRQVWSRRFDNPIEAAPAGCGDRMLVVEGNENSSMRRLHCLSTTDGQSLWNLPLIGWKSKEHRLASVPAVSILMDRQRAYVRVTNDLSCIDWKTGKTLWESANIGTCSVAGDLLFVVEIENESAGRNVAEHRLTLSARDATTGVSLWTAALKRTLVNELQVDSQVLLIPQQDRTAVHSIIDGTFLRMQPATDQRIAVIFDEEVHGKPIMPVVSLKGRAYVSTAQRGIICLGDGSP